MISTEKIIVIEGQDKTGKDTLRDRIVKNSNGKALIIVRSFISQIVYNRIYNRNINENFFWNKFVKEYNNGTVFIILTCNQDIARQRFIDTNEQDLNIDDYHIHASMFHTVCEEAKSRGILMYTFDTSYDSIEITQSKIENAINNHPTF